MASKTAAVAISDILEDLPAINFEKFRKRLLDRREEPRVKCRQVEDKNFLEVTTVLVSTFTEAGAVRVTEEILRAIDCSEHANRLAQQTGGQSSKPASGDTAGPSSGAAGENRMAEGQHFVDKHKIELIQRVSSTAAILDELLQYSLIQGETYNHIRAMSTSQAKMREIYCCALQGGIECKNTFYAILKKYEPYLIKDLEKNN